MYADRYGPRRVDRASLTLSVTIVGGLVAAAMLSNTVIRIAEHARDLPTYNVKLPPPPPKTDPLPPKQVKAPTEQRIDQPKPLVESRPTPTYVAPPDPGPPLTPGTEAGGGTAIVVDPPKPPPVLRGADIDGRYFRDFQPAYPAEERRAGREGAVTLKVLIGTDGRVREVERIAAASDAFWRVTEQRALARWRFRPATRDGVAYESWKTMTVRFRLEEE